MKILDLFKKKKNVPDIGEEDELEGETENLKKDSNKKTNSKEYKKSGLKGKSLVETNTRFEKIEIKLNELTELFTRASKTVEIVKDIKPEELRSDYQKADIKLQALTEKINLNKETVDGVMDELNEFRRKSKLFIGTEGMLKLNEDVKKDLISVQGMVSKVKLHADRAQNIFVEVKKDFTESQKIKAITEHLDNTYSGLRDDIEKLKVTSSNSPDKREVNQAIVEVEEMKADNLRLVELIEKLLLVSEENRKEIKTLEDHKGRKEINNQIESLLKVVEILNGQMNVIKKKLGVHVDHVNLSKPKKVVKKKISKKKKK